MQKVYYLFKINIFNPRFFYKQPSCYGSNVKNGIKVKQLFWQLNCVQQYLGQILVTIEKFLILDTVAFIAKQLLSNF